MGFEEIVPDPRPGGIESALLSQISVWEAEIATEPASEDEPVFVLIEGKDEKVHRFGPCPWQPRISEANVYTAPSRGDRALVAESDEGEWWVIMWWPYG
jgi:hypothetical protein